MQKTVLICCNKTCPKQGSRSILEAFQAQAPADVKVIQAGCFGECGNGPMVRVLPDDVWYAHVQLADVAAIASQHLVKNQPVKAKLYKKFHQNRNTATLWILIFVGFFGFIALLLAMLASQTETF